jgi:hypothetical protein
MEAPRLQPAYLALTNPPDGSIPPFIKGITKFPRPIVATCIRLLTGHAFTGEYTACFRPSSFDPHHCQCGEPMQTVTPLVLSCLHALRLCFLLTIFVRPDRFYRLPDSLRTLPLSRYLAALVSTRLTVLTFLFRLRFSRSCCLCLLSLFS